MGSNNLDKKNILLDIKGLKKYFPIRKGIFKKVVGYVKAVDGVDLFIKKGETLSLTGESGCGKTTLGRCILQLLLPTEGNMYFKFANGSQKNLLDLSKEELKMSKKEIQVIFQDPYSSLNPSVTIFKTMEEPMRIHGVKNVKERKERIANLLESVNLSPDYMFRYPYEFSGGQRQRIGIVRALSLDPRLVICDEPVSALDVSIRAQVLKLLKQFKKKLGLTFLFITHDLSLAEYISDRIAVMYLGKIVEVISTEEFYSNSRHPYSEALISALPIADPNKRKVKIILEGEIPDPSNPPSGCRFHPRCRYAESICKKEEPLLVPVINQEKHFIACHKIKNDSGIF
jgi:oligopeptide/dipeptide ABC transporter ATP-binding protein